MFERVHPELPVFLNPARDPAVFYTPGRIALASPGQAERIRQQWGAGRQGTDALAQRLEQLAGQSARDRRDWLREPFQPVCLTIYLSNRCNLACGYCFAGEQRRGGARETTPMDAAMAAARLVAGNCARSGQPFRLVLHGGGEPTLHWDAVMDLVRLTRELCLGRGLQWWGYLATNGVMPPRRAAWLGRNMSLVGISCDGPPDLHDTQRPMADGSPTSGAVLRTAREILGAGGQLAARATITPRGIQRQGEIAAWLREGLGADSARFEPAYGLWSPGPHAPEHAELFVSQFLLAQDQASQTGMELGISGVRLDELHGPHCQVLRQTLHLLPDGAATACFFCVDRDQAGGRQRSIGRAAPDGAGYVLDHGHIERLRESLAALPSRCMDCPAGYHCARQCPEVCAAQPVQDQDNQPPGFRCLVHRGLAEAWIMRAAHQAAASQTPQASRPAINAGGARAGQASRLLEPVAHMLDRAPILEQLAALRAPYSPEKRGMPRPLWSRRGFAQSGGQAWESLRSLPAPRQAQAPLAVYLHIPFCNRRCAFCDCYSVNPPPAVMARAETRLADRIAGDLEQYAALPAIAGRPVSTIHFGGGTPNCLSRPVFNGIMAALRRNLHLTPETELALESTAELLCGDGLQWLEGLGFTRLHVGVQTLDPPLRRKIGRRTRPEAVLSGVETARARGWTVSVDMLYGLPGQNLSGFLANLDQLARAGAQGFSLYELQRSPRNRAYLRRLGFAEKQALENYLFFQCGHAFLRGRGFAPNHFTHLALSADRNLYYTHARRDEDLLALGPTADGAIGGLLYRHHTLPGFWQDAPGSPPALQGAVRDQRSGSPARELERHLMCARLPDRLASGLAGTAVWGQWLQCGLLQLAPNGDATLTANGSWCLSVMLDQLGEVV